MVSGGPPPPPPPNGKLNSLTFIGTFRVSDTRITTRGPIVYMSVMHGKIQRSKEDLEDEFHVFSCLDVFFFTVRCITLAKY